MKIILCIILSVLISISESILRDFSKCHDDFTLNPPDGIIKEHNAFTWLGFVQYVHVTLGIQHIRTAPRVILVQKQFVLGTARDMLRLPRDYKLGNVIFGQYERDEEDCKLKQSQAKMGITCGLAYIEIAYTDIIPHPEYLRFGVGNSLVLMKLLYPLKSSYMIPVCLPSVIERGKQKKEKSVYMIDYLSSVPKDFAAEMMAKKTLKLYTHLDCTRRRSRSKLGKEGVTHALCTSGCGMRAGAPIITHVPSGPFELVGLSIGGGHCTNRRMRGQFNDDPPLFIDVYPYVAWITNIITAYVIPNSYPARRMLTGGQGMSSRRVYGGSTLRKRIKQKEGWSKRTFMKGNWCYKSRTKQSTHTSIFYTKQRIIPSFFYSEEFEVKCEKPSKLKVFMRISAGVECTICCARLRLPNRLTQPKIEGIGGYNITIEFHTDWLPYAFNFHLGLTGKNTSEADLKEFLAERPNPGYWYK